MSVPGHTGVDFGRSEPRGSLEGSGGIWAQRSLAGEKGGIFPSQLSLGKEILQEQKGRGSGWRSPTHHPGVRDHILVPVLPQEDNPAAT